MKWRQRVSFIATEWSFTIYPTPYNRKYNTPSRSLIKAFSSFIHSNLSAIYVSSNSSGSKRGGAGGGGGAWAIYIYIYLR